MTKLNTLIREARESCEWRGHSMHRFHHTDSTRALGICKRCGKAVQINTNPMPHEIDIGGEAVALNCS